MPLSKVQQEIAERLAELLVQSVLPEDLKEKILDNLDKLPEDAVFKLIDALERESDQLDVIVGKVGTYLDHQEAGWEEVENKQEGIAEQFLEDMAKKLDDEARILELKESI